jgi:hypothetical protein
MGSNSLFSKELAEGSKEQIRLWQETISHLMSKLKTFEDQLREINGSPEKPKKEKTNYALRKVSDSRRHVDKSA